MDFPGGQGGLLGESSKSHSLSGKSVEGVVNKGVHDGHGLLGDTSVGVDLLEDLVDVGGEGLGSLLLAGVDAVSLLSLGTLS